LPTLTLLIFQLPRIESFGAKDRQSPVRTFILSGARIRYGFQMARYRRDLDDIEMPSAAWFTGSATSSPFQAFYATLLHELTHWSGAPHRLGREFGKRFGDHAYAMEELVAELSPNSVSRIG